MGMLEGKVMLITGGTSGIGEGCVKRSAEEGAHVILTGRNQSAGRDVVAMMADSGFEVEYRVQDVSEELGWQKTIKYILEKHGRLDTLVNNAGLSFLKPIEEISLEDFQRLMQVNVEGVFLGTKYGMAAMDLNNPRKGGSIINISSLMGQVGLIWGTAYCASKGAVTHMTKCAAIEGGMNDRNIRVNSIHPGVIWTKMVVDLMGDSEETRDQLRTETPLQVLGVPNDIAEGVVFLASDEASFMTGSEFSIDGGRGAD